MDNNSYTCKCVYFAAGYICCDVCNSWLNTGPKPIFLVGGGVEKNDALKKIQNIVFC